LLLRSRRLPETFAPPDFSIARDPRTDLMMGRVPPGKGAVAVFCLGLPSCRWAGSRSSTGIALGEGELLVRGNLLHHAGRRTIQWYWRAAVPMQQPWLSSRPGAHPFATSPLWLMVASRKGLDPGEPARTPI